MLSSLDKIFKWKIIYSIYQWLKPKFLSFIILICFIFLISYLHSEYISWVELSGNQTFLSISYILKNVSILLSITIFIYINRKKITPEIKQNYKKDFKQVKSEINQVNEKKNHLKSIKEKGELKTEYQRILEGTDEKD